MQEGASTMNRAIDKQKDSATEELKALQAYPDEELIDIIKEVGFQCDMCARCCTREFNDHVFLLEQDLDTIAKIDSESIEPAPYYELCDQYGNFYVSGYALKTKEDGACIFLNEKRCKVYNERPSICRLYPYMLHLEADEDGNIGWRQISGLDLHGCYHNKIDDEECDALVREIRAYEEAFLHQKIAFFNYIDIYFKKYQLRHIQSDYDKALRKLSKGGEAGVFVFCNGGFKEHIVHG